MVSRTQEGLSSKMARIRAQSSVCDLVTGVDKPGQPGTVGEAAVFRTPGCISAAAIEPLPEHKTHEPDSKLAMAALLVGTGYTAREPAAHELRIIQTEPDLI